MILCWANLKFLRNKALPILILVALGGVIAFVLGIGRPLTGIIQTAREPLNHISLRGVSLETKSVCPTPYLTALVFVNASVPLSSLELHINDTYLESMVCTGNMTNYAILYKATVTSQNISIIAGETYKVTFVATFRDGTTSNATALVVAV